MKYLLLLAFIFPVLLSASAESNVSKVSRNTPVFVACDLEKEKSVIKQGLWFKYKKGQLYLAEKDKKNEVKLTKIDGDCTLEPNFIR